MAGTIIRSPLHGWAAPLAEVPDPVFAEGMMGDGVAIDPFEGELCAPCDGEVFQLHRARHALTVRTAEGAEILIHLGLETVALAGEGFQSLVREGDRVAAGQTLLRFDLDLLAQRAKSLISPVLLTNADAFAISGRQTGRVVRLGEPLFEIRPLIGASAPASEPDGQVACRPVRFRHAHGLHARPAGLIAAEVKRWGLPVQATAGDRKANARSPVALMGLGVRAGDELVLTAHGAGADAAVSALVEMIERDINGAPVQGLAAPTPARMAAPADGAIAGVRAAPGLAIGPAFRLSQPPIQLAPVSGDPGEERAALDRALAAVRTELVRQAAAAGAAERDILCAHLELLDDPELVEPARTAVAAGQGAGAAWRATLRVQMDLLRSLDEPRLAERAADLADLERQVLLALGGSAPPAPRPPAGTIILAEDLTPSQMAGLRGAAGICTVRGGPTSHVAILASAMGLPALVAAGERVLEVAEGAVVILDADAGVLIPEPSPAELERERGRAAAMAVSRTAAVAAAQAPCVTADLIAAEADFLSIGTNDLAQYALAMDRTDPELAADVDGLHPAVLRLIRQTVEGARAHGRPVGVCGGLASDLEAAPILIGLGVTELSAAPAAVPALKALVRTLTLDVCRELATRACAQRSAAAVRGLELRQAAGVSS